MKRITELCFLFVVLACCIACSSRNDKNRLQDERRIIVSIEPLRFFTEQIAGDVFIVTSMVPKGSNPETYEPTPQQLVNLSKSDAYLRIGPIGFEELWMGRLTANAPQMQVFEMSKGVEFIRELGQVHEDHVHAGGIEPHIWSSPANARLIAINIYEALCELSPQDSTVFYKRWLALDSTIVHTDSLIKDLFSQGVDSTFLIYHPALSYFARDYGLKQVCMEEGGKEPSPIQLKSLIDFCRENDVKVIFVQREFDTRNAELIATETGTKIISINPLGYDWCNEMLHIAKALKRDE